MDQFSRRPRTRLGFGCLPLLVSAWRSTPRDRFLLLVLLLIIPFSLLPGLWMSAILPLLGILSILLLLLVHPLISAILLTYVSREAATTHSRLSFVVVSGMVLMLLGGLLLNLFVMLSTPSFPPLLFLSVMCAGVIVAFRTLFRLSRSRESMQAQARPKDASPTDVDSSQESRGDRG